MLNVVCLRWGSDSKCYSSCIYNAQGASAYLFGCCDNVAKWLGYDAAFLISSLWGYNALFRSKQIFFKRQVFKGYRMEVLSAWCPESSWTYAESDLCSSWKAKSEKWWSFRGILGVLSKDRIELTVSWRVKKSQRTSKMESGQRQKN